MIGKNALILDISAAARVALGSELMVTSTGVFNGRVPYPVAVVAGIQNGRCRDGRWVGSPIPEDCTHEAGHRQWPRIEPLGTLGPDDQVVPVQRTDHIRKHQQPAGALTLGRCELLESVPIRVRCGGLEGNQFGIGRPVVDAVHNFRCGHQPKRHRMLPGWELRIDGRVVDAVIADGCGVNDQAVGVGFRPFLHFFHQVVGGSKPNPSAVDATAKQGLGASHKVHGSVPVQLFRNPYTRLSAGVCGYIPHSVNGIPSRTRGNKDVHASPRLSFWYHIRMIWT